jgi:hypothetical protein
MITSREMAWAGRVSRIGVIEHAYRILLGNLEKTDHVEDTV